MNDSIPSFGVGQNSICQKCVEKARREHDFEHRIIIRLQAMVLPTAIVGDKDEWQEIKDLLRLMMGVR